MTKIENLLEKIIAISDNDNDIVLSRQRQTSKI